MFRFEDDMEKAHPVPAPISTLRATLFALAGALAAVLVLGVAMFHS